MTPGFFNVFFKLLNFAVGILIQKLLQYNALFGLTCDFRQTDKHHLVVFVLKFWQYIDRKQGEQHGKTE